MDQIPSAIVGAVIALAVSAGERILNRIFSKKEKREASRDADVEMLERVTFEVRDLAKDYWQASGRLEKDESSILGRLQFLSLTIDVLFKDQMASLRTMHVAMNRFDRACTDGNFQSVDRLAEPHRCSVLELAAYSLVHMIKTERRKLS